MTRKEAERKASEGATLVIAYFPFLSDADLRGLKIFVDTEIKKRKEKTDHAETN